MRKLLTAILLGSSLSSGSPEVMIKQEPGIGRVYSVGAEEAFKGISRGCMFSKLEDSWVVKKHSCYDLGFNSTSGSVSTNANDLQRVDLDKNSFVMHSHVFGEGGKYHNPPSFFDMANRDKYRMVGASPEHVGCIDPSGVWFYDWDKKPLRRNDELKVLSLYNDLCVDFVGRQDDVDFDFDSELFDFKKGALDLGIKIGYRSLWK